jgi:hypothetical protein
MTVVVTTTAANGTVRFVDAEIGTTVLSLSCLSAQGTSKYFKNEPDPSLAVCFSTVIQATLEETEILQ